MKSNSSTPSRFSRHGQLGPKRPPLQLPDLQASICQQAIPNRDAQQRKRKGRRVDVQLIQLKDLLAGLDWTAAVAELLLRGARELDALQAVTRQSADLPLDGADVVDGGEEPVDANAQHAAEMHRDGEHDGHDADGEPRVRKHGEKDHAEALAARHDAEGRVRHEEIQARRAVQPHREHGQQAEQARRDELHRDLDRRVVQEKRLERIRPVAVLVVVDVALRRVQCDAVQHADEKHARHGLHEAHPGLH